MGVVASPCGDVNATYFLCPPPPSLVSVSPKCVPLLTLASVSHVSGLPLVALGCVLMFESEVCQPRPPEVALSALPHFWWEPGLFGDMASS